MNSLRLRCVQSGICRGSPHPLKINRVDTLRCVTVHWIAKLFIFVMFVMSSEYTYLPNSGYVMVIFPKHLSIQKVSFATKVATLFKIPHLNMLSNKTKKIEWSVGALFIVCPVSCMIFSSLQTLPLLANMKWNADSFIFKTIYTVMQKVNPD